MTRTKKGMRSQPKKTSPNPGTNTVSHPSLYKNHHAPTSPIKATAENLYFRESPPPTYFPILSHTTRKNACAGVATTCKRSSTNPIAEAAKSVAKGSHVSDLLRKLRFLNQGTSITAKSQKPNAKAGGTSHMRRPPKRGVLVSPSVWNF